MVTEKQPKTKKCIKCKAQISKKESICPHCNTKQPSIALYVGIAAIIFFAIGLFSPDADKPVQDSSDNTTVAAESTSSETSTSTESTEQSAAESQPAIDAASMEITVDSVKQLVSTLVDPAKIISVEIDSSEGTIVDIVLDPGETWDEKAYVREMCDSSTAIFEQLFKSNKIDKVWIWGQTEMIDQKGNSSVENVFNVSLSKENAQDINWPKFKNMVELDYQVLLNVVDSNFIHPGISKNL